MKRAFAAFCVLLTLLACAGFATAQEQINLLSNGSFEELNSTGEPAGWYANSYRSQAGYSRICVTNEKAHGGQYSAMVENASSNDARYMHTVSVEASSLYRLSGYVLVDEMADVGNGANFAIEGIYSVSECLFDTDGEWQYVEWYGETGPKQTQLTFGVRVGGYSAESVGKAYFDDMRLEKVDELPTGVVASLWYDANAGKAAASTTSEETQKKTVLYAALAVLFVLGCYFVRPVLNSERKQLGVHLAVLMMAALAVRIVIAMLCPGYAVDINCFTAWSLRMASKGPIGFYAPDYFCDYPPAAMLLLWPVGWLLRLTGTDSSLSLLVVKLLPVACDMLGAFCLYNYSKRRVSESASVLLAAMYLLNPAVLVNGAAWGQMDSVLALLILITAIYAMECKWGKAIPLFAVSVLTKPQALLFAPIGGMKLLFDLFSAQSEQRKKELRNVFHGIIWALAAVLVIVLPFSIGQENPLGWLFELYGGTIGSYAYASLNTANLYFLIGANWTALSALVPQWLVLAAALLALGACVLLIHPQGRVWLRCGDQTASILSKLLLVAVVFYGAFAVIGISYSLFGYAAMVFVYAFCIVCFYHHRKQKGTLPFYMALALVGIYVLGIKIHERYLFPALLLLLTAYASSRDRRLLALTAGFSATTFLNTVIVLENSVLFGAERGHLNADTQVWNILLCLANLALCFYAFWLGLSGLHASKPLRTKTAEEHAVPQSYLHMLFTQADHRMKLVWKDWLLMTATMAVYSVVAFSNLGSTVAPQTSWVSTSAQEQIVLDLGSEKTFSVLYYGGVNYNDFSISVSSDGEKWSTDHPCSLQQGQCWQWKYAVSSTEQGNGVVQYASDSPSSVLWLTGRYLRINACEAGLNLWEVVVRDQYGNQLPLSVANHTGANADVLSQPHPAENLIDENDTCVGEPSWYNSMYFDEIYHAREAYGNLHQNSMYEWTHPPLGKLLMAGGIAIFGMTPFGWRFAGTLIGVLMLPALYLFAMQLTRKRSIAAVSMAAFALDLMHFTQTRIATIDSFPLFFILISYLFMVRYMQHDILALENNEAPTLLSKAFWRSLIPLACSGVAMGLGIASKWTGIYSAVGLAILFFLTVYRQYRVSSLACEIDVDSSEMTAQEQARVFAAQSYTLKRIAVTCGFCIGFFVLIPCAIYVLSYMPLLLEDGTFSLGRIIQLQQDMLSYHGTPGLGSDHPFQSPWWQWPFILKPIWYVQDKFEPAGYASTIMCLGNPWVFYIGAFAMIGVLVAFVCKYVTVKEGRLALKRGDGDLTLAALVIGFLAQYLPWVLVPRSMYIYHYFASVPFIILATAWFISRISNVKIRCAVIAVYLLGSAVFFVLFFPYASGWLTSTQWLDAMKWFSRLYY